MISPAILLRTIQELHGTPLTILLAMLVISQAVQVGLLAKKTGFSRPTIRSALVELRSQGYVVQDPSGSWDLSETGRSFLYALALTGVPEHILHPPGNPLAQENALKTRTVCPDSYPHTVDYSWIPGSSPGSDRYVYGSEENLFLPGEDNLGAGNKFSSAGGINEPDEKYFSATIVNKFPASLKSLEVKKPYLKIQEEDLNTDSKTDSKNINSSLNLTDSSPARNFPPVEENFSSQPAQTPEIDIRRVLSATGWLFGERVVGRPEQYPNARLLLGTIASVYDHRHQLRKPARVVYANLKAGRDPEDMYLRDPRAFLPDEFCERAGLLMDPPENGADSDQETEVQLPPVIMEALRWFEELIRICTVRVDKTVFQRYLAKSDLLRCDLASGDFVITADDQSSADWLNVNLATTLQKYLRNITIQLLVVSFEVWPPQKEAG